MYTSVVEVTQNREFLDSVRKGWSHGPNLNLLSTLPSYSDCADFEQRLTSTNAITFDKVFHEPLGYHLIKAFLVLNHSDDKAVFVTDVELYKSLTDASARMHISRKIFVKYCASTSTQTDTLRGISVFDRDGSSSVDSESIDDRSNLTMDSSMTRHRHHDVAKPLIYRCIPSVHILALSLSDPFLQKI